MIYVVQMGDNDGPVKIGYSLNPKKRMIDLAVANPYPLTLLATFEGDEIKEAALHRRFIEYRLQGEWFEWCEEISKWLALQSYLLKLPAPSPIAHTRLAARMAVSRRGCRTRKRMMLSREAG